MRTYNHTAVVLVVLLVFACILMFGAMTLLLGDDCGNAGILYTAGVQQSNGCQEMLYILGLRDATPEGR